MDVERLFREESGRALATLIGILGDFDLAEEALQEAFAAAIEKWPGEGEPANARAWIISTARNKAIDRLRRRANFARKQEEIAILAELEREEEPPEDSASAIADDRLRLIFTCCHPALAVEAQVALTLRTLCGLTTEEIARAFLVPVPTMAQRLVRAKNKIRRAGIPYEMPADDVLAERLDGVMTAIYLVFNEGYAATAGDALVRRELCAEAIRLGRILAELMPREPEVRALLSLMLLHDSRREARVDRDGELVLLDVQDRSRWDHEEIRTGLDLLDRAVRDGARGPYALQAAVAAVHAEAAHPADTDWRRIVEVYSAMLALQPSPVVELNRAVAVAMADGPAAGLALLDDLEARGELRGYHLLPAARGDLLRRLERWREAAEAYRSALSLAGNDAERRFLNRRVAEVEGRLG